MHSVRIATRILAALVVASFCLPAAPAAAGDRPAVLLAAGDIAYCKRTWPEKLIDRLRGLGRFKRGAKTTARLLDRLEGTIVVLGDLAYRHGTAEQFEKCYGTTWGRHKARTWPVPGNHEYRSDPEARPYFEYWGARAGEAGRGYYSFELGGWHIVALNSNISARANSRQIRWLRRDLAATTARCILAFWHHPVFSTGHGDDDPTMMAAYEALYAAGASVVLGGHDHNYERLGPLDPEGKSDPTYGLRSFVVGTGGAPLTRNKFDRVREHSEAISSRAWGVLKLTLHDDRYDWEFVPIDGHSFTDSGSETCVPRHPPPQIAQ